MARLFGLVAEDIATSTTGFLVTGGALLGCGTTDISKERIAVVGGVFLVHGRQIAILWCLCAGMWLIALGLPESLLVE